jgi:DNA-binding winged helix-turn-helix (wHTH) protein
MNDPASNFYEFETFRVDGARRLLLREGVPVQLTPKTFETLLVLVRSGGRIMSKSEMMSAIWPDIFVEESNLAQNIFLLRRALSEGKNEHRYIVTIPGLGYRFVPSVTESETAPPSRSVPPAAEQPINSIAVLPFKPLSENGDDKCLGLGLADAVIIRLSGLLSLKILPTSAILRFCGSSLDPRRAGCDLGVEALLDGFYQHDGEQLRVSVQLIRVCDCVTLWAAKFDVKLTDFFALQDSISEQVAKALALKLSGEEKPRLSIAWDFERERLRRCS